MKLPFETLERWLKWAERMHATHLLILKEVNEFSVLFGPAAVYRDESPTRIIELYKTKIRDVDEVYKLHEPWDAQIKNARTWNV